MFRLEPSLPEIRCSLRNVVNLKLKKLGSFSGQRSSLPSSPHTWSDGDKNHAAAKSCRFRIQRGISHTGVFGALKLLHASPLPSS